MLVSKFSDDADRIQTGIFGESVRHNLQGISVGTEAVGLQTRQSVGVFLQLDGNFDFRSTTTDNQVPRRQIALVVVSFFGNGLMFGHLLLLDDGTDNGQSVVQ